MLPKGEHSVPCPPVKLPWAENGDLSRLAGCSDVAVIELVRTNDPVLISWIQALLADAGVEALVLDAYTSMVEGSIGAIPRRLMVLHEDVEAARRLLRAAGVREIRG